MFRRIFSLDEILEESEGYPVFVYKHSATCERSVKAEKQVIAYMSAYNEDVYRLVVQDERPLSDEIAKKFNVKHETPQLLILNGSNHPLVLNHENITKENIEKLLQ